MKSKADCYAMVTIGSGGMNIHKNYLTTGAGEKSKKGENCNAKNLETEDVSD